MLATAVALLSLLDGIVLLSLGSPHPAPRTHHVPLRQRSPGRKVHKPGELAAMAEGLRLKYSLPTLASQSTSQGVDRRAAGAVGVAVQDQDSDSSYTALLNIGTPGSSFDVILDTGSSDLWVASSQCNDGCGSSRRFGGSASSSFVNAQNSVTIQYGQGNVVGGIGSDTVKMGNFSLQKQTFVQATQVSDITLDNGVSGLLGLGFKSIAASGAKPFVQALADNGQLEDPVMSFFLERVKDQNNPAPVEQGSVLTLGGTNSSLFTGSIDFVDIPSSVTPGFWMLPLTGFTVQNASIPSPSGNTPLAAIDTGTTLIGGPSDQVAALYSHIDGAAPGSGQFETFWTIPCTSDVSLSFSFGGANSWPMSSTDFVQLAAQDRSGQTTCVGAVFDAGSSSSVGIPSTSTNPAWIIGAAFLKNVYSVFRFSPPSVGFAQLSGSNAEPGANVGGSGGRNGATRTASHTAILLLPLILCLWM